MLSLRQNLPPQRTAFQAAVGSGVVTLLVIGFTISMPLNLNAAGPPAEKIVLGGDELTGGIPVSGRQLRFKDIKAWLEDENNHETIEIALPESLQASASNIYVPEDNPLTRAKIELGRQLYFDTRLSSDNTISCADCHHPDEGYGKHTQFGVGVDGQEGNRNSPISYNRILSKAQFWDGRAESLEAQAVGPIDNPIEMANTHENAVATIKNIPGYRVQFRKIFGSDVTIDNVGKAIAAFERVLVTGPAPADYYGRLASFEKAYAEELAELDLIKDEEPELYEQYQQLRKAVEEHPISESAKRGYHLFSSERSGCSLCHTGANFSDEQYHNLGVGMEAKNPDLGRYEVTREDKDRGAFKTPTLRNVALSAPYMHDGSQATLEEVVDWYVKGGHPNPHLSDKVKRLELTEQEEADLVAFMEALTGPFPKVEMGRLPPDRRTAKKEN